VLDERRDSLERDARVPRRGSGGEVDPALEQRATQPARGVEGRLADARRVGQQMGERHGVRPARAELRHGTGERGIEREQSALDGSQRRERHEGFRDREDRVGVADVRHPVAARPEGRDIRHPVGGRDAEHGGRQRSRLDLPLGPIEGVAETGHERSPEVMLQRYTSRRNLLALWLVNAM
jgi:hypothetical protein